MCWSIEKDEGEGKDPVKLIKALSNLLINLSNLLKGNVRLFQNASEASSIFSKLVREPEFENFPGLIAFF